MGGGRVSGGVSGGKGVGGREGGRVREGLGVGGRW